MTDKSYSRSNKKDELLTRIERLEAALANSSKQSTSECDSGTGTDLERRIAALESRISGSTEIEADAAPLHFCSLPKTPSRQLDPNVSANRARLIQTLEKKWVNGTKLRYSVFDRGPWSAGNDQKDLVRQAFGIWKNIGIGITFEEISDVNTAEIRIGFLRGDGSWSYIGRDIVDIPGRSERTMNFGWDLTTDPRRAYVAVHEIGHTLGLPPRTSQSVLGYHLGRTSCPSLFRRSPK